MKNVTIALTDEQVAQIEVEIATGDFASPSEVIAAALQEFLDPGLDFVAPLPDGPSEAQILADIDAAEADLAAGVEPLDAETVLERLRIIARG